MNVFVSNVCLVCPLCVVISLSVSLSPFSLPPSLYDSLPSSLYLSLSLSLLPSPPSPFPLSLLILQVAKGCVLAMKHIVKEHHMVSFTSSSSSYTDPVLEEAKLYWSQGKADIAMILMKNILEKVHHLRIYTQFYLLLIYMHYKATKAWLCMDAHCTGYLGLLMCYYCKCRNVNED